MNRRATIYLDQDLHRALRLKAASTDRSISEIIGEAVRRDLAEDADDLAAFEERRDELSIAFEKAVQKLRRSGKL